MPKGSNSGSASDVVKTKLNRLLHRTPPTPTPPRQNDKNESPEDAIQGRKRQLSISKYLANLPPLDPFIEHDEIRRQKRLTEEYDDRFLKKPGMQRAPDCCDSCSKIDFHAISDHKSTLEGSTAFSLREIGRINASWSKRTCHFCRFLASVWEENKSYFRNASLCLIILSSRHILDHSTTKAPKASAYHNVLVLSHPQPRRVFDVDDAILDNIDVVGALFPKRRRVDIKKSVSVRSVPASVVDLSIVEQWLQNCNKYHGEFCVNSELPNIPGFQLLNCATRKLEPYLPGTKYVALSYVCGTKVDQEAMDVPDASISSLPLTIEDALNVTQELGFRYLWVDRYCMPRSDEGARHIHIASMGLIYSCASLTIVAACGRTLAYGLPGVSSRSRLPQLSVRIDDYEIISTLSNPVRDVRDSVWMSRGWTYQEALLSKRRLVITDKQLYFECGGGTSREAISEPEMLISEQAIDTTKHDTSLGEPSSLVFTRHRLFPTDYLNQTRKDAWLIHHQIAEYTSRSLTFESDIINAFSGILRHFKNPICSVSHMWGVPVLWSADKWTAMEGFATGLCWIGNYPTTQAIERRAGFPSWSWVGRKWKISAKSHFYRYGFKTPYDIQISFETISGDILDFDRYQAISQHSESPEISPYLHIEAWSLKCRLFPASDIDASADYSLRSHCSLVIEGSESTLSSVVIHKSFSREEWEARKDILWDILIIGNTEAPVSGDKKYFELLPPFGPFFMILEDMGDHHERIGYMDLAHCGDTAVGKDMSQYLVGKKRRTFRLG